MRAEMSERPRETGGGTAEVPVCERQASAVGNARPSDGTPGLLEEVLCRENLRAAYARVVSNGGAPGVDGMSVEELMPYCREHWAAIRETLSAWDPGFVGLCYDCGHGNCDEDGLGHLDDLRDRLISVHLHDNDGQSDSHGPIGSGTAPFEELFEYLSKRERRPVVTLEPHEEASFWQSLEALEKLWPWED